MPPKKATKAAAPAKGKAKAPTSKAKAPAGKAAKATGTTKKAASTKVSQDKVKKTTAKKTDSKTAAAKAAATKSTAATKKTKSSTAASAPSSKATTPAASASESKAKAGAAKASTAKKATKAASTKTTSAAGKKRAREEDEESRKEEPAPKRPAAPKRPGPAINAAPTDKLKVFVFGEGSSGELGLGHMNEENKKVIDVKRPRLNPNLLPEDVGVVQVSAGGMHVVALTHDNKILTWGVNDQGALGRSTKTGEQFKDIDAEDDEDDLNSGLNSLEAAPAEVDYINVPEGTIFTKVAAGDSITMALTSTGLVYGCGTFRGNEGVLGFSKEVLVQQTLAPIPKLRNVKDITCGANHVLALDKKGSVFAFGAGQQNQLGRRVVERTILNGLTPSEFGLPRGKIESIAAGAYHSFATDRSGDIWAWGANSRGQTGIADTVGEDRATILKPQRVEALKGKEVTGLAGGTHHSIAKTATGDVLFWGRCDGAQSGMDLDEVPEANFFVDDDDKVDKRVIAVPTLLPEPKNAHMVAASSDHCLTVTNDGKAYSWGFSENYQTGQGSTEDVEEATLIDNTATRNEKLVWAGAGGQYSMLASVAMDGVEKTNLKMNIKKPVEPKLNGAKTNGEVTAEKTTKEKATENMNGTKDGADGVAETAVDSTTT